MMWQPPPEDFEPDDRADAELYLLFLSCAKTLAKSNDAGKFLDWIAEAGPHLAPQLAAAVHPSSGPAGHFFRTVGVQIYNAMPLPDADFRRRPLPRPGRNDPCFCGSGYKYKQCCRGAAEMLDFSNFNMLPYMLDALPKKVFASLPDSAVDVEMVYDAARQWHEEGEVERAVALLEPWFAPKHRLTGKLEPLFDQLVDGYLELGRERKRRRFVEDVIARGDRELRAAAIMRLATMQADQGDFDAAWETFQRAQREKPDDPNLATLEITLLMSRGMQDQARERARFWVTRLERMRNWDLGDLIDWLRRVAEDPAGAMAGIGRGMYPDLDRLVRLYADAPGLEVHYRIEDGGALVADTAVTDLESNWRRIFPYVKPGLTAVQHDEPSVWDAASRWLTFLEKNPLAWQSFDILDDLVMAVDALQLPGVGSTVLDPLLQRGVLLLEQVIHAAGEGDVELPWACWENRPALRLLAHLAFRVLDAGQGESPGPAFITLAERLVTLNPTDNHGIRTDLARAYLANDEPEKALTLSDRFPDDFCGMTLNRILALYRLDRRGQALQELNDAAGYHAVAIKMLLAADPKPPRMSDTGITVGGKDEAWLYRIAHRPLWEQDGGLAWLQAAWRGLPAASKRR